MWSFKEMMTNLQISLESVPDKDDKYIHTYIHTQTDRRDWEVTS